MKAFKPLSSSLRVLSTKSSLNPCSITSHKSLQSQFTLSQALLPSRQRITKPCITSHSIKLDFSNMRNCLELPRLNLACANQHIQNLRASLSKASMIYELTITIMSDTWHQGCQHMVQQLFRALPRLKCIQKLNLYFSSSRIIDSTVLKDLSQSLRRLRKLNSTNIQIQYCQNITYQEIPRLLLPLRRHALKEVNVSFFGYVSSSYYKPKQQPLHVLKKLRRCRSIGLELDVNNIFNDSDFLVLTNGIKRMSGLGSFSLKLGNKNQGDLSNFSDNITDQGLLTFVGALYDMKYLNKLSLDIMSCKKISEDGVRQCVLNYFDPTRFRKLSYRFDGFGSSKSTKALVFADFLAQFKDPKDIKLNVVSYPDFTITYSAPQDPIFGIEGEIKVSCNVPSGMHWEEYHLFAKSFSHLSNLKAFNFACRDAAYTWELNQQVILAKSLPMHLPVLNNNLLFLTIGIDDVMKVSQASSVINLLTNLTNIKGLSLHLPQCAALQEETLNRIMNLLPFITGLRHLEILFSMSLRLTDSVIFALAKSLSQYKQLEHLKLQFEMTKSITNKGILKLVEVIEQVPLLKNLSLSFQDCPLLTAKFLEALPDALSALYELQGLTLIFPGIPDTSNLDIQRLGSSISRLKDLRNIKLDFSNNEEISDSGLYALGKSIIQVGKVKYLEISLDNCWRLGNEGICQVGKQFKSLKELFSLKMSLKGCESITTEGVNQLIGDMCAVEKLEFLTLDFGAGDHMGEVFHRADVYLKFERMENISLNLKASKDIFPQRVGDLRKSLGEIRQVAIFFK